ncbi:MAG: hypothetical protein L0227_04970 [Chloroflexi bacterium]|nr:hypothetical protein [Chloroflexota bacterium]
MGLVLSVGALLPTATPALAADPILPQPTADVTFLSDIEFSGVARLSGGLERMEIVIDIQGSGGSFVAEVPVPDDSGGVKLSYVLDTAGGSLFPNTTVEAHFRATLDDGSTVSGPTVSLRYEDTRLDWNVRTGKFVTVHWTAGGAEFGRRALQIADDAVEEVTDLLGVTESEPIDFYIYASNDDFYDVIGPGARENVGGEAHPDIRTLFAQISEFQIDASWVGSVIPHELTHLVFDTAVANPYHYPSRWLNEGLAVYLADGYTPGDQVAVERAVEAGTLMPLTALTGQFPTTNDQFGLAYAESASAVDFLVREYGRAAMVQLVRSFADGVTEDEAFEAALGVDVAGFEAAWLADLGAEPPVPYGPVEAPAGPVPSDWVGGGEVPGPIVTASPGATEPPAAPTPGGGGGGDPKGLLIALLAAGLVTVGAGIWLARRERAAGRAAAVARIGQVVDPSSPATSHLPPPAGSDPPPPGSVAGQSPPAPVGPPPPAPPSPVEEPGDGEPPPGEGGGIRP